jgi:hypothetical protein
MIVTRTVEPRIGVITLRYSFRKSGKGTVVHIGENDKALMEKSAVGRKAMAMIIDDLGSRGVISMARQNGKPLPDQQSIASWRKHFLG